MRSSQFLEINEPFFSISKSRLHLVIVWVFLSTVYLEITKSEMQNLEQRTELTIWLFLFPNRSGNSLKKGLVT